MHTLREPPAPLDFFSLCVKQKQPDLVDRPLVLAV